jgi:DNA polymerase III delta subunit
VADIAGLLLVHGDEPHLVDATVEQWRAAIDGGDLEVIDAPTKLEQLIASLVDMPLFAARRDVLVRDLPQLSAAKRGTAGVDELVRALGMRSPTTHLCFAVRGTVTPGNPILAAIVASGGQLVHHDRLRSSDRRRWLEAEVNARHRR